MAKSPLGRRTFLHGSAVSVLALAQTASAGQIGGSTERFAYEITRTDAEWREMLSPPEYAVLRKGSTELPKSNPLWDNFADGTYCCRGCELPVYDSVWKTPLDKGWAFFLQSRENTVMMGIDGAPPEGMSDANRPTAMIEAHCRRCGSHLGHILTVGRRTLHCINGTSLEFRPSVV